MALASTHVKSTGVVHRAYGKRSGTRTAGDFTINLGFQPHYFRIINVTDGKMNEWFDGMNVGDYIATVWASGIGTLTTNDSISIVDGVVTVDVSVDGIETDDDLVIWDAWA